MPKTTLDDAVNELRKWFLLFSLGEFVAGDLIRKIVPQPPTGLPGADALEVGQDAVNAHIAGITIHPGGEIPAIIEAISRIILNTQRGGFTSPVLIKRIVNLSKEMERAGVTDPKIVKAISEFVISDIITAFYELEEFTSDQLGSENAITDVLGGTSGKNLYGINSNPMAPSKDTPTVSIFFNRTTLISLSNKNGNALSIFFNTIPTMEWSRAIPFIDIKFQLQRPSLSATDNRAVTPSIIKFLEGSAQLVKSSNLPGGVPNPAGAGETFNLKLQSAVSVDNDFALTGDQNPDGIGEAGTELFLLPQTLINAETDNAETNRVTPVIDLFRPLASLRKFEVDVSQAAGSISYRTAKLHFTLHDRSRLNEIADFIKAGLYNKTEILIEWGWEHPDKSGDNVFADFINALKIKEKYQVSNYDLQMKTNGEIDIILSIFTKGGVDLYTSKIADTDSSMQPQEVVRHLQERIADLRLRVFKQNSKFVEEIRGQQILNTAGDHNSNIELSPKLITQLTKTLKQLGRNNPSESAKQLRKELEELYGDDGKTGAARDLITSINMAINEKFKIINSKTPDPFLLPKGLRFKGLPKSAGERPKEKFVSLAKLLLLFVIQPLARTKRFDDIQVIFYNINDHAGFAANKNLGEFPIEISNFKRIYAKIATRRRVPNLTLQEFIRFISSQYLENITSPLYGLRDLYNQYEPNKDTGGAVPKRKFRNNPTKLSNIITDRMEEAGVPDGDFKLPQVDVYVECVPAAPDKEGEAESVFEGLTILRIHIFDRLANAFEGQQAFLTAQRRDAIQSLGNVSNERENEDKFKTSIKKLLAKAKESELIESIVLPPGGKGSDTVVRFKGGPTEIKNFIAQTMPTIFYGVNNTAVLDAGLKTLQDQKLTSINMINAGDKGDLTPNGGATNGLPIRVFPAQMSMRTLGCPIIEFTQSMFCDFGTGTSFDNIYAATRIQHSLEPGKFYTSITWTPLDAYGQYQSAVQKVGDAIAILSDYDDSQIVNPF